MFRKIVRILDERGLFLYGMVETFKDENIVFMCEESFKDFLKIKEPESAPQIQEENEQRV